MNKKLKTIGLVGLLLLSGCASNNIKKFDPSKSLTCKVKKNLKRDVCLGNITMAEGDKNAIMCRLAGNIYLPDKKTYSQYISHALESTLEASEKFSENKNCKKLTVKLDKIDFSSTSGYWDISGAVSVGSKEIKRIESRTEFGTSFDAISACSNTAAAFDNAVENFISKILNDPEIFSKLN